MGRHVRAGRSAGSARNLIRFGVAIPEPLLEEFDSHLRESAYGNRSEAIRDLIRSHLTDKSWTGDDADGTATLTLLVEREDAEAQRRVQAALGEMGALLVSSMRVRLNGTEDLYLLVLQGNSAEMREHAQRLVGLRGVGSGKLVKAGNGSNGHGGNGSNGSNGSNGKH